MQFWSQIDRLAEKSGKSWHDWVVAELVAKPDGIGSASWLRVRCLANTVEGA